MELQTVSCLFIALSPVTNTSTETGHSPEMPDRPNRGDATHTLKSFFFFLMKETQFIVMKSFMFYILNIVDRI